MILGGSFRKCIFKTDIVILRKSDNPVSITHLVWNERGSFASIISM